MAFTWDTFLKPLNENDRNIKIIDTNGLVVNTINPFSIVNAFVNGNLLRVSLKSGNTITIPFSSLNESQLALPRIKSFKYSLTTSQTPASIDPMIRNYVQNNASQVVSSSTAPNGSSLREGTIWFDGEKLLVYAKNDDGVLDWIVPKQGQEKEFFYQSSAPNLENASPGSFWFNTTNGLLNILIQDGINKSWQPVGNGESNRFFYQENAPEGTGTSTIPVGSFWFDTTDGILYIYVKDTETENHYWVTASTSFSSGNLFEFFYQSSQPEGTGTGEIPVGSLWYDTEDGTLFVYVRDGNSDDFVWVTSYGAVGPEGPVGATGSVDLKLLSLESLNINSDEFNYDLSISLNYMHPEINNNYVANFIGINSDSEFIQSKIVLNNGDIVYKPTEFRILGQTQSVKWQNAVDYESILPNSVSVLEFTIIYTGNVSQILGKVVNYI